MTTVPGEPEESDGRDELDDPQALDAAFDQIVANINHPGTAASTAPWPEAEGDDERDVTPDAAAAAAPMIAPQPTWEEWDDVRVPPPDESDEDSDNEDEGHYVPPPPPPVPKGDKISRWAWAGAIGAPLLAIVLPLLGWRLDGFTGMFLVAAFLAGFITLISRLRTGPRIDDGPEDGAVV